MISQSLIPLSSSISVLQVPVSKNTHSLDSFNFSILITFTQLGPVFIRIDHMVRPPMCTPKRALFVPIYNHELAHNPSTEVVEVLFLSLRQKTVPRDKTRPPVLDVNNFWTYGFSLTHSCNKPPYPRIQLHTIATEIQKFWLL